MMVDWQKGDLALCVDLSVNGFGIRPITRIQRGCVYTVAEVGFDRIDNVEALRLQDVLADDVITGMYRTSRFRKITPGAQIEGIEVERRVKVPAISEARSDPLPAAGDI
jgi:hypothetical protein